MCKLTKVVVAWLSFDESMRVRRVARDKDGDGAPEQAQSIGGDGRARGEPELIADAKAIEERVLAPDVSSEPEAETKPEPQAQAAAPFKVWRIYPLDWRLWTALGIVGLSLLPFAMALRKR